MSGPELKPCPFCGGEAQLFGQIPAYCGAKVSCTDCEAESSSFRALNNCDDANKSAIAAWNRRTPDPAQIRADALLTDAARDVLAERARQVSVEGWAPEHDDANGAGQMALAAGCYAMFASVSDSERASTDLPGSLASLGKPIRGWAAWLQIWPWDRKWWKPTDRRRDLVKAAALILAEIERLDRATPLSPTAVDGSPAPDAGGKGGM